MSKSVDNNACDEIQVYQRGWRSRNGFVQTVHDFTLMTYNVLTDVYTHQGDYVYCPAQCRYTNHRIPRVVKEVQFYLPDIVCFQEVGESLYHSLLSPELTKLGYTGCHLPYTKNYPDDGLAIFCKANKFDLVQTHGFQMEEMLNKYTKIKNVDSHLVDSLCKLVKRCGGLIIGVFRNKSDNKLIAIGNLQIGWSAFQLSSLQTLEVAVCYAALKESADGYPFILCGDFNSPPTFAPYRLLDTLDKKNPISHRFPDFRLFEMKTNTDGSYDFKAETVEVSSTKKLRQLAENLDQKRKDIADVSNAILEQFLASFSTDRPLKSAYKSVMGDEPHTTNCDAEAWPGYVHEICVDYLWYTSGIDVSRVLEAPPRECLRRHLALPSVMFPSDHIPLMAHFSLT